MGPGGDRASKSAAWSAAYLAASRGSVLVAVPILLHGLGTDLYAVWVLSGSLIFAQSLVDLGFGAALVRFVAVGAAQGSAHSVRVVFSRVALIYAGLSLLGGLLWIFGGAIARGLPYLHDAQVGDTVVLLRYMAVAFAITNATTVVSAALQGLNRVAAAYRAQTVGALAFVPTLLAGMAFLPAVHAAGIATLVTYGLPFLLLVPSLWGTMHGLTRNAAEPPTWRMMLAVGTRWQVSSWADFATFQLPRIAAGVTLSSGAVVTVDLALRFGQAVATPLLAVLPIVLPRASGAWARLGREGVRAFMRPLLRVGTPLFVLLGAVAIPITGPAIETWSSHALALADAVAAACVVAGVLAHASTGALSSVMLATGRLSTVVRFKSLQLCLALPLVFIGALLGSATLGVGLGLALVVPAAWFNAQAASEIGLRMSPPRWLYLGAITVMATTSAVALIVTPLATAAITLTTTCVVGSIAAITVLRTADPELTQRLLGGLASGIAGISRHRHDDAPRCIPDPPGAGSS